eukprot:7077678-Karenia_brevis.AAC.1
MRTQILESRLDKLAREFAQRDSMGTEVQAFVDKRFIELEHKFNERTKSACDDLGEMAKLVRMQTEASS